MSGFKGMPSVRRMVLLIVVAFSLWFLWPRTANLRRFDPRVMAQIETDAWRHYYAHDWLALTWDIGSGARRSYGFSPYRSCVIGWYAMDAARVFQASRSRSEAMQAIPALTHYFEAIQAGIDDPIDISEAARLELEWWQLRREKQTWQQYGITVSKATAVLYAMPHEPLDEACLKRAEMMSLRDRQGKAMTAADWDRIEQGLRDAWTALSAQVRR